MNDSLRGDLFSEYCPSREVLKHVTSRWGVLLLVALTDGAHRFGELRRKVGGISEKMLAQTLQWLEQDGFVQRIAHPVVPPHVEYRLTPLGEEIGRKVGDLAAWIEGNMDGIRAAQRKVAAANHRMDLLLCAQNTPRSISVGQVVAVPNSQGRATVTTTYANRRHTSFTAYVSLDARRPMQLSNVNCGLAHR